MSNAPTLDNPVYLVSTPRNMPDLMFDTYWRAFEHATGLRLTDETEGHDKESNISIMDFGEPVKAPIAEV